MSTPAKYEALSEQEWLDLHRDPYVITASKVGTILGVNPWCSEYEQWAIDTGKLSQQDPGIPAQIGHVLEPFIAAEFERRHPQMHIGDPGDFTVVQHPVYDWLYCTPDRMVNNAVPLECKYSNPMDKSDWVEQDGPLSYQAQVQVQMACLGADHGYLMALVGYDFHEYTFEFSQRFFDLVVKKCEKYLECVAMDKPPAIDYSHRNTVDVLKGMHPNDNGETVGLPAKFDELVEEYWALSRDIKMADGRKSEIQAMFIEAIGPNTFGTTEEGRSVSLKTDKRGNRRLNIPNAPKLDE